MTGDHVVVIEVAIIARVEFVANQRPTATRAAGIRSWNELGRRVRRGEKGIMIFAPMIGYERNASEGDAPRAPPAAYRS